MSTDDPFSNDDFGNGTMIIPLPGGRGAPAQPSSPDAPTPPQTSRMRNPSGQSFAPQAGGHSTASVKILGSGLNSLVDAATPLLNLASQLRNTVTQDNVLGLRDELIQQLRLFEDKARTVGSSQETVLTARYLLCTAIDESVLGTPWGSESDWASQSLLSTFHNETWGGEKFFQVMDNMMNEPSRNLEILELIYICLAFGFKGKYGISDRGNSQLLEIQDNLYRTIVMQRGEFERELSPHWRGVQDTRFSLVKYVPLWVVAALAGVLLFIVYGGFRFIIGSSTEPIYEEINQIRQEQIIEYKLNARAPESINSEIE